MENWDSDKVEPLNIKADFKSPTMDEWRKTVEKDLKGADFDRKLVWRSPDGFSTQPIYTKEDIEGLDQTGQLPGFEPYGRGSWPLSGVKPPWQIRQDCVLASPEDVNAALRDGIARGQNAIAIRLDDAARRGLDGDSPQARELSGRSGVTISSVNGLWLALNEIDLTKYPITIRTGTASVALLGMLVSLLRERDIDTQLVAGAMDCDPLRELLKSGTVRGNMNLQFHEMADMASFCAAECPGIRPVTVNSNIYSRSGASIVYELAATMATGVEYLRAMARRGLDINDAAKAMLFNFSVTTSLFPEIAKLRAARMLWSKIIKAMGVDDDYAGRMFLHVRTSTYTKVKYDVHNNIVRNAIEAFAGAVGGCDSMYVAPFDEPVGRPDAQSSRIARNQQILLQEESHLNRVVDPGGGSYYIESLTDQIGREAWREFQEIQRAGGMLAAIEKGDVQKRIAEVADKKRKLVTQRRTPVVGVSNYVAENANYEEKSYVAREKFLKLRRIRLNRLKSQRPQSELKDSLTGIQDAISHSSTNCMEAVITAAKAGATIREITSALTSGATNDRPVVPVLPIERASVPFEELRDQAGTLDAPPAVTLVLFGNLTMRRVRADFCLNFYRAGAFNVIEMPPMEEMDDATAKEILSQSPIVTFCSDDNSYPEKIPGFAEKLKSLNPQAHLIVAGNPASAEELKAKGVDEFVHIKSDAVEVLSRLLDLVAKAQEAQA